MPHHEQPLGWNPTNPEQFGALVGGKVQSDLGEYTPARIRQIEDQAAAEADIQLPTHPVDRIRFRLHMFEDIQD